MNKIKEEELKNIIDQQSKLSKAINEIGLLETRKHALLHEVALINQEAEELKQELEKSYGQVNINLEDGSYTKIEKEAEELEVENV